MSPRYPALSPRGEISRALKQMWPGGFVLRRRGQGYGVTLAHDALGRTFTMKIDDRQVRHDMTAIVRKLVRKAWADFLARAEAGIDGLDEAMLGSRSAVPERLQADVKRRPRA